MLQQQVPKHVGSGLGWISSRALLEAAVGVPPIALRTSVPIAIRCVLVCGQQWLHGDVGLPWVEDVGLPSVCPHCVLWLLGGGSGEFPIATFSLPAGRRLDLHGAHGHFPG